MEKIGQTIWKQSNIVFHYPVPILNTLDIISCYHCYPVWANFCIIARPTASIQSTVRLKDALKCYVKIVRKNDIVIGVKHKHTNTWEFISISISACLTIYELTKVEAEPAPANMEAKRALTFELKTTLRKTYRWCHKGFVQFFSHS